MRFDGKTAGRAVILGLGLLLLLYLVPTIVSILVERAP